jgi:hypothetical protein
LVRGGFFGISGGGGVTIGSSSAVEAADGMGVNLCNPGERSFLEFAALLLLMAGGARPAEVDFENS